MKETGHTNRTRFRNTVLLPLIEAGLVAPTIPDKPRSSKQRYCVTGKGRQWCGPGGARLTGPSELPGGATAVVVPPIVV